MGNEIWKDITGYEGLYQVSNLGRIRNGHLKIMKQSLGTTGYFRVNLWINSTQKIKKVHRLIAIAFIPNPENKPQINHINSIRTDNRIENLEWVTNQENCIHAYSIGGRKAPYKGLFGKDNPRSKKVFQYDKNMNFINAFYSRLEANRLTGVNHAHISDCVNNKRNFAGGFIWKNELHLEKK